MADERDFEPRLGRIRSSGGGRGMSYLQWVLRAAVLSGPAKSGTIKFQGSRIARGFGAGKVLAETSCRPSGHAASSSKPAS
jgi:hypothetical protein